MKQNSIPQPILRLLGLFLIPLGIALVGVSIFLMIGFWMEGKEVFNSVKLWNLIIYALFLGGLGSILIPSGYTLLTTKQQNSKIELVPFQVLILSGCFILVSMVIVFVIGLGTGDSNFRRSAFGFLMLGGLGWSFLNEGLKKRKKKIIEFNK